MLQNEHSEIVEKLVKMIYVIRSSITKKYGLVTDIKDIAAIRLSIPYCSEVMLLEGDTFVDQFT